MIDGTIEKIAFGGHGILRHDHFVIFVPFASPQDFVKIEIVKKKKTHAFGKILQILRPSPLRQKPICPFFQNCGGCQLQHLPYSLQTQVKKGFIEDSLRTIGKISSQVSMIASQKEFYYRRHIRLKLSPKETGFAAGFMGTDPASFIPITSCPLFQPIENLVWEELQIFLNSLNPRGIIEGSLKIFKLEKQKHFLAFTFAPKLPMNAHHIAEKALLDLCSLTGIAMQAPGISKHWGNQQLSFCIENLRFHYSPWGFIQNHPEQSEMLYLAIKELLDPHSDRVLDLYCGVGISSLLIGKTGKKVIGIESQPESIYFAEKNKLLNQIFSVNFICAKVEDVIQTALKDLKPTSIVMNPPRQGISSKMMQHLLEAKIPEILYISCMPSTLARDLKIFTEAKYHISSIRAFDLFPQTTHVETLVRLVL